MVAFKLHRYFTFVSCSGYCIMSRACATASTNEACLTDARVDARVIRVAKRELTTRMRAEPESQATCTSYVPGTQAVFARLLI